MLIKKIFGGVKEGSKEFGEGITIVINFILLTFVYFVGVGITSIIAKIFKKDFLKMKINSNCRSYWEDIESSDKKEDYYKQF